MIPASLTYEGDRIAVQFGFNRTLIAEVKAMEGARWHGFETPKRKIWTIKDSPRNAFQLAYLQGKNPYAHYDKDILENSYERPLYEHQGEIADFMLTRHYCVIAADCGVGKTLSAIEAMERAKVATCWYVAPRSALRGVDRELKQWDCKIKPTMMTYEGLTKTMKNWQSSKAPQFVVFDESSRVKNSTAQRSQAALALANGVREDWGDDGYIILMSGTPAPKSPVDFWHQCEIACPGFLKEGSQNKFKRGLAVIVEKETFVGGGTYPHIVSWLDDEKKCAVCGEVHGTIDLDCDHAFVPSVNEVARLYKRMQGLVLVKSKKDCLDLPDKIYRTIELEPSKSMINVARTIVKTASTTIKGLILLRELSDGFQYQEKHVGDTICSVCNGAKTVPSPLDDSKIVDCDGCGGKGTKKKFERTTIQCPCPKDEALRDLLDEYGEVGRLVIYGGFQGSIDRIEEIVKGVGWETITVDGRGWRSSLEGDPLTNFQDCQVDIPKLAFIAQPSSGGMGITLHASPAIVYYSNDYNAESRLQSEDRIHRAGMDTNIGATIIDLLHLPSDQLVLDSLKKKRRLQSIALGQLAECYENL